MMTQRIETLRPNIGLSDEELEEYWTKLFGQQMLEEVGK